MRKHATKPNAYRGFYRKQITFRMEISSFVLATYQLKKSILPNSVPSQKLLMQCRCIIVNQTYYFKNVCGAVFAKRMPTYGIIHKNLGEQYISSLLWHVRFFFFSRCGFVRGKKNKLRFDIRRWQIWRRVTVAVLIDGKETRGKKNNKKWRLISRIGAGFRKEKKKIVWKCPVPIARIADNYFTKKIPQLVKNTFYAWAKLGFQILFLLKIHV